MKPALIDTHVYLSRWPFRRVRGDEPSELASLLKSADVTRAWAGTLDALLHFDLGSANARLAEDCRRHGKDLFVPFGAVNPALPDWKDELRRCQEVHSMPGIRLHPNYHGYKLDSAEFRELLAAAAQRKLLVQLAVCMEDERTQNPLVHVPPTDLKPLPDVLKKVPEARLQLLHWAKSPAPVIQQTAATGQASFDLAMLENVGGIRQQLGKIPLEKILFGSFAPVFYLESALLKLQESALSADERLAIASGNARRLL